MLQCSLLRFCKSQHPQYFQVTVLIHLIRPVTCHRAFGPALILDLFFGPCVTLTLIAFDKWFKKNIQAKLSFHGPKFFFFFFILTKCWMQVRFVPGHTTSANVKLDCYVTGHIPDDSIDSEIE